MRWTPGFRALALAAFGLVASACSCDEGAIDSLAPSFALEGPAVGADPAGEAHFGIDFGTVPVGSRIAPEVFVVNKGSANLRVKLETPEIEQPFALASGTFDLRPKARRPIEFSFSPRAEGDFSTLVEFSTNEHGARRTVRLFGSAAPSKFTCDPVELDLGYVVMGESRSGTVNCTNGLNIPTTLTLGDFFGASSPYFRAEIQGMGDGRTAEVPAGATVTIEIRFTADGVNGPVAATLPLLDSSSEVIESIHVNAQALEFALQVLYENANGDRVPLSGCYDFPDTDIQMESFRSLWVRNVSRNSVAITGVHIDGEDVDFHYLGPSFEEGVTIAPEGQEEVELPLSFTPQIAKAHVANLVIKGVGNRATPLNGLRACIQGQGGGARISCMPSEIHFGPVAWETEVVRSYKCTNSAILREGSPAQLLVVRGVKTTEFSRFSAVIRELNGEEGPNPDGYLPGDEFWVDVTYAPEGPEDHALDTAIVHIDNNSTANSDHQTPVSGIARDLPPCDFDLGPETLRFGVMAPGTQRTLTAYVVNRSETHECIISNLRLSDDTHPAFTMEPVESVVIPPRPPVGQEGTEYRYPIRVTFAPDAIETFEGSVEFFISHPDMPRQSIPLTGLGRRPCLEVDPGEIDFGAAPPMCSGREVIVSIRNACTTDLILEDVFVDEAFPWFKFSALPMRPQELPVGDQLDFHVFFSPDDVGDFEGAITVQVTAPMGDDESEELEYQIPVQGRGQHDAIQTDAFNQAARPKVDVLWVIDNSGSMNQEQALLQDKLPLFMKFAIEQNIDFHIGVTTTGISDFPSTGSCPGGFGGNENGRLFPSVSEGRPRLLKSTMPSDELMDAFSHNVLVGLCHGAEAVLEAAKRALSDPWINTPLDQDGNMGFLRRDASLSIIGVTDEPDAQSADPVPDYVDFFQRLKPTSRKDSVKIHMISGGDTPCSSATMGSATACPRCVDAAELSGGLHIEICKEIDDPAWDEAFLAMSEGAFGHETAFRLRGEPANPDAIEVHVNGRRRLPVTGNGARVWRYNSENNSIAFTPLYVPGPNQLIEVTYEVACKHYDPVGH